jgi:hypothetical protein
MFDAVFLERPLQEKRIRGIVFDQKQSSRSRSIPHFALPCRSLNARRLTGRSARSDTSDCKTERRSSSRLRLDPDLTSQSLDDFLADRQADPGSGDIPAVQAFEEPEYLIVIFRRNPDSVVSNLNEPFLLKRLAADPNLNGRLAPILDGIADKVLEKLDQMALASLDNGQWIE